MRRPRVIEMEKCQFCDGMHKLEDCFDYRMDCRVAELERKVKHLENPEIDER